MEKLLVMVFSKDFYNRHVKTRAFLGKGQDKFHYLSYMICHLQNSLLSITRSLEFCNLVRNISIVETMDSDEKGKMTPFAITIVNPQKRILAEPKDRIGHL